MKTNERKNATPDVVIRNCGTVVQFTPVSDHGRNWLHNNTDDERFSTLGRTRCANPKLAKPIVELALLDGLVLGGA